MMDTFDDAGLAHPELMLYRTLYRALPEFVWMRDLDGKYLAANPSYCAFMARSEPEIVGKTCADFFPPDTAADLLRQDRETADACEPLHFETWIDGADGQRILAEIIKVAVRHPDGRNLGVLGIARDVSVRREAEKILRESEERYRHFFDESRAVMLLIDPENGKIVDANQAACSYYGYEKDALLRLRISDINTLSREEVAQEMKRAHSQSRDHFFFRHRLADGRIRDVEVHSGPFEAGKRTLLYSIVHDITNQRRAEEKARLASSVFNHGHDGILITDSSERILDVNETFCELTGYSREEVIGKTPRLLNSGRQGPEFYAEMWKQIQEHGYWHGEIWNRRKNGEAYAELLTITGVRAPSGEIGHYVGVFSDITQSKIQSKQLETLAHYDTLTRLPNRVLLLERFKHALAQAKHASRMLGIACLDLDGFKAINDQLGQNAGDRLLVEAAQRLKKCLRPSDTVARLGGDEFIVLLGNLDSVEDGERALQEILETIARPFTLDGQEVVVTASIGLTFSPDDGADPEILMRHADQAMYRAKEMGRNRYHLFDPEHGRRMQIHRDVRVQIERALAQEELVLYYQPKVDMRSGRVLGAEALIRWKHPEKGLLGPGAFLPHIEESDQIVQVGAWVLEEALRQMAAWQSQGLALPVSVNVAPRQLQAPDFCEHLAALLAAYPELPPESLQLEVLESTALDDMERIGEIIQDCRGLGISVALDDFGTGYSTLTYLKRLPADQLKIDKSFVGDMLGDPGAQAIVEAIIGLAEAFRRTVIAEGAETPEHCAMLLEMGCDVAQGYGIAKPMPAAELPVWVSQFRPHPLWLPVMAASA